VTSPEHTTLANQAFNCIPGAQFLDDPFRFCFHQIGDVAMNKKFSQLKANNIVRRDPAIRTTNPEILRSLLPSELLEEIRLGFS
jgi:hypothetical protein